MNRLQHQTSPYLLQHAANPVDWHPWGPEALALAKAENKPVIVSIGYSTCHWCHVMERESFENEAVAAYMNEHFVCIKVDREERPDVDNLYMEACQAISGGGGWPLNAFLLPDGKPFYAGTYFPPRSAHNRPGWRELLERIATLWQKDQAALEEQAAKITAGIVESSGLFIGESDVDELYSHDSIDRMIGQLKQRYDLRRGGFGGAPKFPMSQSLELLLDYGLLRQDEASIQLVEHAVQSMISGGIYDQLRGGFARYTVDGAWRVPHFEKMLYDNALLLRLMGKLQLSRPKAIYASAIQETVDWLRAEMLHPQGAFYAALDADSEGVEGKFYVWSGAELKNLVSPEEWELLSGYFGVTEAGNWEEEQTNILYRSTPLSTEQLELWIKLQSKLLKERSKRIRPGRDEKVILQWNALIISGLCYGYQSSNVESLKELALNAYDGLSTLLQDEAGHWYRNAKDGQRGQKAFLDDLTALNTARLDLYNITYDWSLVEAAEKSVNEILERFGGGPGGLYYLVPPEETEIPVVTLDLYDNALPSGNGQLLHLLYRLSELSGKPEYRQLAEEKFSSIGQSVLKYPTSFANLGRLLLHLSSANRELVISGPGAEQAAREVAATYRPNLSIVVVKTKSDEIPSHSGRYNEKDLQFYLCENQSCRLPVSSLEQLKL
ncbi:thioredoxin domain-containing protein [Lewinellaceae bacterium SD302]|nr:thioredoxin domain-containing protein [Lewinellaceae bacterium SD302]